MVTYAPDKRLSPADALRHPWFLEAPLPSANALVGPAGERAGGSAGYPRRMAELAARAKRKAEDAPPAPRAEPPARRESVVPPRPHASAYQWD